MNKKLKKEFIELALKIRMSSVTGADDYKALCELYSVKFNELYDVGLNINSIIDEIMPQLDDISKKYTTKNKHIRVPNVQRIS